MSEKFKSSRPRGAWRRPRLSIVFMVLAGLVLSLVVVVSPVAGPAQATGWTNCGGGPNMRFMNVQSKGLLCSSAWILGEEVLESWDGFSRNVTVRGFKCKMSSGYPYHVGVGGTCKKGNKGAKFFTGD